MKSKNKKYIVRAKTLNKVIKEFNPLFNVWYNKNDGWWLETEKREIFLGCDSLGAFTSIMNRVWDKIL